MLLQNQYRLSRAKMLRQLDTLQDTGGDARTLYLPRGLAAVGIERALAALPEVPPVVPEEVSRSGTGAVLFWGEACRWLVRPPFPLGAREEYAGCQVGPLRALLLRDRTVGVVLVRLGAYAVGVFQGEKLLSSKVGTGNVHQRHRQGGSSAHRFERHRDKQIEAFFTRICSHAREHLEPHLRQMEYLAYGGTRETVLALRRQCEFLDRLGYCTLDSLLNIREPRQATLLAAISDVYSSRVTEWVEEA